MDKSPDAFRTISEVAEHLDTPAHVLRFWESRFPQIKPVKRAGGRRYYRPSDIALLTGIKRLLHDEGLTIRGVQKILRDHGVRQVAGLTDDTVSLGDLAGADTAAPRPAASLSEVDLDEPVADPRNMSLDEIEAPVERPVAPPPDAASIAHNPSAQFGLPLFDAPPPMAAPRKPTLRDDATLPV